MLEKEKEDLEKKYDDFSSREKTELAKIERKPHENLEFQNRITMFRAIYEVMWVGTTEKDTQKFIPASDLETVKCSHLLIIDNNEGTFDDFAHDTKSFLKK